MEFDPAKNERNKLEQADPENPEWTAQDFKRASAFEALPKNLQKTLKGRGRPKIEAPKVAVSLRLSPDVLSGFKETGKGWQSRLDAALREWLERRRAA
ncbi:MAG: BrnA antitoxin family protein [Rhodospirillales bacterium]|nr:BrnA antitoxin family protein [Rhodospirillales bacterium]